MPRHHPRPGQRRPGKALVLFVLLLPVLIGMLGLVIDSGLLMAAHRQSHNAADAAALAAAYDLMRGKSLGTATTTATTYVQTHNGLSNSTVTVNSPPSSGPYAGNSKYVEAIVTTPVNTLFIQVLGVNSSQSVQARAVAGYEAVSGGEGVAVLDPTAIPGLSIAGGGTLLVKGRVVVNSQGRGQDENGATVDLGYQSYAASTGNNSRLQAALVEVVGGVDVPANFQPIPGNTGNPLHARALPEPDPLIELPTPTTANGAQNQFWQLSGNTLVSATTPQNVSVSGASANVTFQPGVYSSITVSSGNATFLPGIYIIGPGSNGGGTRLNLTTGGVVTGTGVMFYTTGSNFNVTTGLPDINDVNRSPGTDAPAASFGGVNISGSNVNLSPIDNINSKFNGMLFYQRRWNTSEISVQGNSDQTKLAGTLYAKWAKFKVSGSGKYDAQFVAGSLAVSGQANITVNYAGKNLGKANRVFLVE